MIRAIDLGGFFKIPADNRDLNYDKYIEKGNSNLTISASYHSHNASRLDIEDMKEMLLKLNLFR